MSSPTKLGVFFLIFGSNRVRQLELVAGLPPGRYDSKWRFGLGGASSNSQWWENVKNMREKPWQNMTKQPKMVEKRQSQQAVFFQANICPKHWRFLGGKELSQQLWSRSQEFISWYATFSFSEDLCVMPLVLGWRKIPISEMDGNQL